MKDRINFLLSRLGEKLWIKPLIMCVLSIAGAFMARTADDTELGEFVPDINSGSIETLLKTISSSMLVIATFAVASMISAYASASSTATPRSFNLVVADDVSQNALSAFIGAFIFSIVSLVAIGNGYYDKAGRFTLFALTILVFVIVIITFVRWVDRVARLGRLATTIDKVETATADSLKKRRRAPNLGGVPVTQRPAEAQAIFGTSIGYVQRVDMESLQKIADELKARIEVAALPGTFAAPGRVLAYCVSDEGKAFDGETECIEEAFVIGDNRTFDDDPRFGLVVLSEIASRALSPGINDPGTAIDVIGTLVRLFAAWGQPVTSDDEIASSFDRVAVPDLSLDDMFDDAFNAIARDGAATIEVVVRLQKAFKSLGTIMDPGMQHLAQQHSREALVKAEQCLAFATDRIVARQSAEFAEPLTKSGA